MTDDTVTAKLAEWEALVEGATEGPWAPWLDQDGAKHMQGRLMVGNADAVIPDGETWIEGVDVNPIAECYTPEDRAFIAAAREMVPALLAAVQGVLRVCDEPRGGCGDDYTDGWTAGWADALLEVRRAITQQIGGEA